MSAEVDKLFAFKSLLTIPSNVLPLHLKQIFPPIIWIFTESEGNGIESRLPFKIFPTLIGDFQNSNFWNFLGPEEIDIKRNLSDDIFFKSLSLKSPALALVPKCPSLIGLKLNFVIWHDISSSSQYCRQMSLYSRCPEGSTNQAYSSGFYFWFS